jgi:hypothetical protein
MAPLQQSTNGAAQQTVTTAILLAVEGCVLAF